jgi:hypothetical protein
MAKSSIDLARFKSPSSEYRRSRSSCAVLRLQRQG